MGTSGSKDYYDSSGGLKMNCTYLHEKRETAGRSIRCTCILYNIIRIGLESTFELLRTRQSTYGSCKSDPKSDLSPENPLCRIVSGAMTRSCTPGFVSPCSYSASSISEGGEVLLRYLEMVIYKYKQK